MKKLLPGLGVCLMILISLTGCEKEPSTLLTDGVWDFDNMTTDSQDESIKSLVAFAKAIFTDAKLEFNTDGSYLLTSPLLEEPITATWSLVGDDQLILNEEDGGTSTANIENLDKKELKYIETYVDQNMNSYSVTTTWVRD
jgi:hypothetical protein